MEKDVAWSESRLPRQICHWIHTRCKMNENFMQEKNIGLSIRTQLPKILGFDLVLSLSQVPERLILRSSLTYRACDDLGISKNQFIVGENLSFLRISQPIACSLPRSFFLLSETRLTGKFIPESGKRPQPQFRNVLPDQLVKPLSFLHPRRDKSVGLGWKVMHIIIISNSSRL